MSLRIKHFRTPLKRLAAAADRRYVRRTGALVKLTRCTSIERFVQVEGQAIVWVVRQELELGVYDGAERTISEDWGLSPAHDHCHFSEIGSLTAALREAGPQESIVASAMASRELFVDMVARAYGLHLKVLRPGSNAAHIAINHGTKPAQFKPTRVDESGVSFRFIEFSAPFSSEAEARRFGIYDGHFAFESLTLTEPKLVVEW